MKQHALKCAVEGNMEGLDDAEDKKQSDSLAELVRLNDATDLGKPSCFPISHDTIRVQLNNCKNIPKLCKINVIQYKPLNAENWVAIPVTEDNFQFDITNLEEDVVYHFKVLYLCKNKEYISSEESDPLSTLKFSTGLEINKNNQHEFVNVESSSSQSDPEIFISSDTEVEEYMSLSSDNEGSDSVSIDINLKHKEEHESLTASKQHKSKVDDSSLITLKTLLPGGPVCLSLESRTINVESSSSQSEHEIFISPDTELENCRSISSVNVESDSVSIDNIPQYKEEQENMTASKNHKSEVDESSSLNLKPLLPGSPVCVCLDSRTINVKWEPIIKDQNLLQYYEVRYKEVSKETRGWNSVSTNDSECTISFLDLDRRKSFYFKVRAIYDDTEGPFSELSRPVLLLQDQDVDQPSIPNIVQNMSNLISLNWERPMTTTGEVVCYEIKFKKADPLVKKWLAKITKSDETEMAIDELEHDVEYVFKVRAMIDGEDGPYSKPLVVRTSPKSKPAFLHTKISSTADSISLSWDCPDKNTIDTRTHFEIRYRSLKNGPKWFSSSVDASKKNTVIKNLESDTDFEVKVREVCGEIEHPFSETSVISTKAAIDSLSLSTEHCDFIVQIIGDTSITIAWNNFVETVGKKYCFEIKYRRQGEKWCTKSTVGNENNYVIEGLLPSTTYEITMRAVLDGIDTPFARKQEVKTKMQLIPGKFKDNIKPILPVILEVSTHSIAIKWEPTADETDSVIHYEVRYQTNSKTQFALKTMYTKECAVKIDNLHPGTEYGIKLRALYFEKDGEFSDLIVISTEPLNDNAINLEVKKVSFDYVSLFWLKPKGEKTIDSYNVKYRECPKGKWMFQSTVNTAITVNGLLEGTRYEFRIRTIFDEAEGPLSQSKEITTLAEQQHIKNRRPGIPEALFVTFDSIRIGWKSPHDQNDIRYYEVKFRPRNTEEWIVHTSTEKSTTLSNLNQSTHYEVMVRSVYDDALGPLSAVVELRTFSEDQVHRNDPPGVPEAISGGYCHIILKWSKSKSWKKEIDHYEVNYLQREDKEDDTLQTNAISPLNKYHVQALEPSTDYIFRVKGVFTDKSMTQYSKWSNNTATKNCVIENIKADEITHDTLSFSWKQPTPSEEIKYFEAMWRENLTGIEEWQSNRMKANNFSIPGLKDSTEYNVKVRCIFNQDLKSKCFHLRPHPTTKLHPEKKFPGKPVLLESTARTIKLSWEACKLPKIDYYKIKYHECGTETNKWMSLCTEKSETRHTVSDLRNDTNYEFKIAAVVDGETGQFSEVSDKMATKLSLAKRLLVKAELYQRNKLLKVYKLPIEYLTMNRTTKTRKCVIDQSIFDQQDDNRINKKTESLTQKFSNWIWAKKPERNNGCKDKTIMLVGATGSGKSTLVDGMINYVTDVTLEDDFRFILVDLLGVEKERRKDQTVSQTDWITTYRVPRMNCGKLDYNLNIIDTPGFGDTRGIARDKQLVSQVKALFEARDEHGIQMIDGVCFVTQSSAARLTQSEEYIFNAILSLFGRDIAENILVLITFADGKRPPVLDTLKKAKVPYTDSFMFNNSALLEEKRDEFSRMFWKMGEQSFNTFFNKLKTVEPKSLQLTTDVLRTRGVLEVTIEGLQKQILLGMNQLNSIRQEGEILKRHRSDIENNKNFHYEVEEAVMEEFKLKEGEYVTNCLTCNSTCHYPCRIPNNDGKKGCSAMDNLGYCTVCQKRCNWDVHRNAKFRLESTKRKVSKTYNDLKLKFEIAKKETISQEAILEKVKEKFLQLRKDVNERIKGVRKCINDLEKYALRPNPLSDVEYIDQLIASEQQSLEYGWEDRVKLFKTFKQEAQLIRDAKTGNLEPFKDTDEILRSFDINC